MSAEAALILDDYHLIVTPAIHTAVAFLLDHLPPQLHLIMLTRADPPLSLTRLRSRGELAELRAADLCFTADEAVTFLTDVMGLPLTNDQLAAAKAQLAGAQANLARTKAGPLASELLAAQAQVDSAQAEVAAARVDLARREPFQRRRLGRPQCLRCARSPEPHLCDLVRGVRKWAADLRDRTDLRGFV